MATTTNSRDVSLKILVDAVGQEGVDALRKAFGDLAKEGADAAPEVQRLTDQIDRLSNQQEAITTLKELGDEATQLASKEEAAAAALANTNARLTEQRTEVAATRVAQQEATAALIAAQQAYNQTGGALKLLRAEYDAAGKKTDEYKTQLRDLLTTQVEQNNAIVQARAAQAEATAAANGAVSAQTKLEAAQRKGAVAAQAAADAAEAQQRALNEAKAAADALGVSTDDLAASELALARDMGAVVSAATDRVAAIREMAEADRLLAIEEQTLLGLMQRGQDALRAEEAAQRDAARSAEAYTAALERSNAARRAEQAAIESAAAAKREQQEADRLAIIQLSNLAAVRARGVQDLAAERAALEQAERGAREYAAAQEALAQSQREASAAIEAANQRLADSFTTVGIRSVQDLQQEIAGVRTAMATIASQAGTTGAALSSAFAAGEARIQSLEREIRAVTDQLTLADRASNLLKNSLGQIAAGNVIADGVGYLVNKVKELGAAFIDVTVQTERTRKGLQAVYKDATIAGQQFQFMRDTANAAGVSIGSINDAFLRFSAATKSANIPLSVTNDLFRSVTQAGATLGLTGEQVTGTLDALGQMASKGAVSMEELRQQLGDRLPGALSLAATGLGITDQQLIKLVESGSLATRDFFPAFSAGLKTMAGDTNTLTGAWQRFTNVLNEGAVAIGDAGGLTVLKLAVQGLTVVFGLAGAVVQGFAEVLNLAARTTVFFYEAVKGNGKEALVELTAQFEKSADRVSRYQAAVDAAINSGDQQTASLQKTATAIANTASGTLALAAASEKAAAGATVASNAYVQQLVRLSENSAAVEAAVTSSEKLLKAKQDEGRAQVLTAQLTGNASAALTANATAAINNAAASQQVVEARTREVNVTQSAITLVNAERDARGQLTSDRQAFLDKLTTQLQLQDAELERSRQSTIELGRQALAAQTAADAYADNSTKVDGYRTAMENANVVAAILTAQVEAQTAAMAELQDQLDTGKITQEAYNQAKANLQATTDALNTATGDAARYENLYRDAVQDSVAAIDLKSRSASASVSVTQAQVNVEQRHYETLARVAQMQGDEASATQFSTLAKYKQIDAVRLAAQIKNLELDADRAGIEVQLAALDPQDALYQQKRRELEIRLELIKAKKIEAGASEDVVRGIQAEIQAAQNFSNQRAPASNQGGPGGPGGGGGGFGGRGGRPETFTNRVPIDLAQSTINSRQQYTADDIPMLEAAAKQAADAKQFIDATARGTPGSVSTQAINDANAMVASTRNALEMARRAEAEAGRQASKAAAPAAAAGAPASLNGTKTVNINIGGKGNQVTLVDDGSADTLVGVLRQLETMSGTASKK